MNIVGHFINGQVVVDEQRTQEIFDPALALVRCAGKGCLHLPEQPVKSPLLRAQQ